MDCTINSHSCFAHKIQINEIQPVAVSEDVQLHVDLVGSCDFVIPTGQQGIINIFITQEVTAEITIYCADTTDLTVRLILLFPPCADITVSVIMCGNQSKIAVLALCALAKQQFVKIKTHQIHCGKHSQSKLVLQGLITDHAKLTYDGMIRIEQDACGTYALQNNKNILLSGTASAISIPNIEVLNHDVQCYHGAAVGKFDLQHMYYMQSRGLSELQIKQLLVQELFAQILQGYEKRDFILQKVYENI